MGTDIHSVGQVRIKGEWKNEIPRVADDPRDYNLFSILADVRNGVGFAGVETGEAWKVLYPSRGLPLDTEIIDDAIPLAEPYYSKYDEEKKYPYNEVWLGDHSHSYLNLKELKEIYNYFESRYYKTIGYISKKQSEELDKGVLPDRWCGWTSDKSAVQRSWNTPALDNVDLQVYVDALEELKKLHNVEDEDVRIVFGFDS